MRQKLILLLLFTAVMRVACLAEEGMWIPMLLKKYTIEDMQKQGFRLTAEDVYSINQASLKDAVVGLGREGRPFFHFCTGNLVSDQGLVITNHHCAFAMIQNHSSLERNYLRDGFWAADKSQELANPGVTASVLMRMEDVTEKINSQVTEDMTEAERGSKIKEIADRLEKEAVAGTDLQASVKPYFNGNQFFMSVFKIYKDVRLVGAPPSAIGKFGGDTDNWMWPRHTGDFAVLRIYADGKNEPAAYSEKNRPYHPDRFFKVSARGVKEGDFTMVFGYPGTTMEYLPSFAVEQIQNVENPHKIAIRTAKLNIINDAMESDEMLRIQYAAKAASVANAWKKWQGEVKGLKRFNTVESKRRTEEEFQLWAAGNDKYNRIVDRYKQLYAQRDSLIKALVYLNEAGTNGAEVLAYAWKALGTAREGKETAGKELMQEAGEFYKNYDPATDQKILAELLHLYNRNLSSGWIPAEVARAGKEGTDRYAEKMFRTSAFTDQQRFQSLLKEKKSASMIARMEKDPVIRLYNSLLELNISNILPELTRINNELNRLNRLWLAGLMEMQPERNFYADANSTLRVAYGHVKGYSPADGVYYKHYTTLDGIMEKDNPDIYDYDVPQKLREIYAGGDLGSYQQDGKIPVCFIATNHTTGGNSGSCVLNADGELIGLNFDRAWDGVMSDLQYDPVICRNISVDIRYVLFIMEKLAGANHLTAEMEIVR